MFSHFLKSMYLTRGEKAFVSAYAIVIAVSAGLTILIMSGVEGQSAIPSEPSLYVFWVIFAGALSGGIGLFSARGWMGKSGNIGLARAVVGVVAVGLVSAIVAGTLILPKYGTFYAPFLLLTEFIEKPWLAAVWSATLVGAHYLMAMLTNELASGTGRAGKRRASEQLSPLSRAQLYNYRG